MTTTIGECAACGVNAPIEQLNTRRDETRCPACPDRRRLGWERLPERFLSVVFICLVFLFYGLSTESGGASPGRVMLVIAAVYVLLTVVHEGGHALMAKLTGRTVVGIVIGHGPNRLLRFSVRGMVFEIRANLLGGKTLALDHPGRWGQALFVLGGIGAELVVIGAALIWDPGVGETANLIRNAILTFATFDIAANLWPYTFSMPPRGRIPNDGRQLLDVFKGTSKKSGSIELTSQDSAYYLMAETDDAQVSLQRAAADFAVDPDREVSRFAYGTQLVQAGRWSEAVEVLSPLQGWTDLDTQTKAIMLNNLAWSALMTFDESLLGDADRWSDEAARLWPVEPAISSTRGSTLVMMKEADEGMPLLLRAYQTCGDAPASKALVSGFAALGAAVQGNRVLVRNRYAAMVDYDAACEIRIEVEKRIAEPEVQAFAALIADPRTGELDTHHLSNEELQSVPTMAALALRWINGTSGPERIADGDVVPHRDRDIPAAAIRGAARLVLADQILDS